MLKELHTGWPDLARANAGCQIEFEFQIDKEYFLSLSISSVFHGLYLY